jgi:hypothetical protein
MKFELDFKTFILRFEAPDIRKPIQLAWLYAILKPIETLHQSFLDYRDLKLDEVVYNSQTIVLEHLLNKKFTLANNLIYIDNVYDNVEKVYDYFLDENEEAGYDYFLSEDKDTFITYLSEDSNEYDFVVYVPNNFVLDEILMRAIIKKYVLSSIRFTIKIYPI